MESRSRHSTNHARLPVNCLTGNPNLAKNASCLLIMLIPGSKTSINLAMSNTSSTSVSAIASGHRQIRAVFGNRTVVFGAIHAGDPITFTPEKDSVVVWPRVSGPTEAQIAASLKVSGYTVIEPENTADSGYDLALIAPDGARVLVDIKLRDGPPTEREKERLTAELRDRCSQEERWEIWRFSKDRLSLVIYSLSEDQMHLEVLVPLNVWEATSDRVFEQKEVLDRVEDWENRLSNLFTQVKQWVADRPVLQVGTSRTVTMSEELMRNFGVPDRELPILDVLQGQETLASLVPRALWIIGANGRVDLITRGGTQILVHDTTLLPPMWQVADQGDRTKLRLFDKRKFFELLEAE